LTSNLKNKPGITGIMSVNPGKSPIKTAERAETAGNLPPKVLSRLLTLFPGMSD